MENTKKKTFWQMVKYLLVSIGVTLIQLLLVTVLYVVMKDITTPLPGILEDIFSEQVMGQGHSNWGYLLPFLLSNLIANAVGYFVNKSKTFK
ncbi:hypothetical protein IJZ97_00640, partial [bacterium]|nr:hypothetical protein [bacterium]